MAACLTTLLCGATVIVTITTILTPQQIVYLLGNSFFFYRWIMFLLHFNQNRGDADEWRNKLFLSEASRPIVSRAILLSLLNYFWGVLRLQRALGV